jgi:hypothetical protein
LNFELCFLGDILIWVISGVPGLARAARQFGSYTAIWLTLIASLPYPIWAGIN